MRSVRTGWVLSLSLSLLSPIQDNQNWVIRGLSEKERSWELVERTVGVAIGMFTLEYEANTCMFTSSRTRNLFHKFIGLIEDWALAYLHLRAFGS